jgi:hypothetical protein
LPTQLRVRLFVTASLQFCENKAASWVAKHKVWEAGVALEMGSPTLADLCGLGVVN